MPGEGSGSNGAEATLAVDAGTCASFSLLASSSMAFNRAFIASSSCLQRNRLRQCSYCRAACVRA